MNIPGVRIKAIVKDSAAYNTFGLRPGSVVTRVDGKPARDVWFAELDGAVKRGHRV